jgi:hypothetical protein
MGELDEEVCLCNNILISYGTKSSKNAGIQLLAI